MASTPSTDLAFLTVAEAAALLREREVSSVELTRACLERIERYAEGTFAFITTTPELALNQARTADSEIASGAYKGPWHGIPIVLKDLIATAGILSTAGTAALDDWIPSEDATVWARLKAAGAVLLGKTNLHELAAGFSNVNPFYGTTRNPWSPGLNHITGGSSGGNGVAVASGMALASIGSDTAGSIRVPSALCGITGLKPTHGLVSTFNCIYLSWSLDHLGPMAHSAEDAALMLSVISGRDPLDPLCADVPAQDYTAGLDRGVQGLRLALPMGTRFWDYPELDPEIAAAVRGAVEVLEGLGARTDEVRIPGIDELPADSTIAFEQAYHLQHLFRARRHRFSPPLQNRIKAGLEGKAVDYIRALRNQAEVRALLEEGLKDYDAYVLPTVPLFPPTVEQAAEQGSIRRIGQFTSPFNRSGQPALTVPAGFGKDGFPLGMMIVTRRFADGLALRIGHAYQQATDWHRRRPPLPD